MTDKIITAIEDNVDETREFLMDMIRFESMPGNERDIIHFCNGKFAQAGCECKLASISDDIKNDPEYSNADMPLFYDGRANLLAYRRGTGGGRSVILQSHVDIVPAGDWQDAFMPKASGDWIYGRGAMDAKGQVAAIWLALKTLQDLNIELKGEVQAQVVVEEEVGGNGALALIRQGYTADAVIVLEGSDLNIHPANRGAIWYRIEIEGMPCHMGRKHDGISAIDLSYKVIQALYEYEKRIIADSANYPGFEKYKNPVQVNVGMLHSGDWPATVAANAVIEGGVGFLPNRTMEQVKRELNEVIGNIDDKWLQEHINIEFPKLHNDSYETDYSHPAVAALMEACQDSNIKSEICGWNVSCDARLYAKVGGMPTIVFGPGSITDAHGKNEKIDVNQITKAAEAIVRFALKWCN